MSGVANAVSIEDDEKAARLAAALRENLKRRKARDRALEAPGDADEPKR
jgi:hypothetical protein